MPWTEELDREFQEYFPRFNEPIAMAPERKPASDMWYRLLGLSIFVGSLSLVALVVMSCLK